MVKKDGNTSINVLIHKRDSLKMTILFSLKDLFFNKINFKKYSQFVFKKSLFSLFSLFDDNVLFSKEKKEIEEWNQSENIF